MPCVKRSGRVVFGLSRTGMVFKLTDPDVHARALAVPGAHLFDPSGRGQPFRQWVVVPPEQADEWEPLAAEAVAQDHSLPQRDPRAERADPALRAGHPRHRSRCTTADVSRDMRERQARCVNQHRRSPSR